MAKPSCKHETNTHCIHQSELKSFSGCRQRWDFTYRGHWSPYTPILPLEFGTAIHKGMEIFFDPELWGKLDNEEKLQRALIAFDAENDKQRVKYITQAFADDTLDDYEERKRLGAGMLTNYARVIHPQFDTWFKPVKTEVSFHVPLYDENGNNVRCYNSECGQEHDFGAICTLDGTIDVVVKDLVNGGYYIIDWKTAAKLIKNDKHLYLDNQVGSYPAALREYLKIDVRGFLYIQLLKKYPEAPKLNTRKTKGRWYSTAKGQATTYDIALSTFKTYDRDAYDDKAYDEYLEYLKENPPKFDARFAIRQSNTHAKNVLANISMQAQDMVSSHLKIYPQPSEMNCKSCSFYEPCAEKLNGEDYEFTLRENYVSGVNKEDAYVYSESDSEASEEI